jgi:hypothetical protein
MRREKETSSSNNNIKKDAWEEGEKITVSCVDLTVDARRDKKSVRHLTQHQDLRSRAKNSQQIN